MPTLLPVGTEIRKRHEGTLYVVVATTTGFRLFKDGNVLGHYSSLTATAQAVRGSNAAVNGWDFFGIPNPNRRSVNRRGRNVVAGGTTGEQTTSAPKGKCKHVGCYEPADCKHGFCSRHCTVGGHTLQSYSARRYPATNAPHVGVEIEVEYGTAEDYRRGLPFEGHADGSLGTYGAEYKLLATTDKITSVASELVEEIWKRGARVNRRCGLHVHLDVRQISRDRRLAWMDWMMRTQETWFNLMPPSRRTNNFVQRITSAGDAAHYVWAHVTGYNTLEVRLHGSTLNPYKITGWLVALIHLQTKAADASYTFPNTGDANADFWSVFEGCPAEGIEYLRTRERLGGRLADHAFRAIEE